MARNVSFFLVSHVTSVRFENDSILRCVEKWPGFQVIHSLVEIVVILGYTLLSRSQAFYGPFVLSDCTRNSLDIVYNFMTVLSFLTPSIDVAATFSQ